MDFEDLLSKFRYVFKREATRPIVFIASAASRQFEDLLPRDVAQAIQNQFYEITGY